MATSIAIHADLMNTSRPAVLIPEVFMPGACGFSSALIHPHPLYPSAADSQENHFE
jgi:hypothetical protein